MLQNTAKATERLPEKKAAQRRKKDLHEESKAFQSPKPHNFKMHTISEMCEAESHYKRPHIPKGAIPRFVGYPSSFSVGGKSHLGKACCTIRKRQQKQQMKIEL